VLSPSFKFILPMPCSIKVQMSKLCLLWVANAKQFVGQIAVSTVVGILLHCRRPTAVMCWI
jgi:hypothetical protein